MSIIRGLNTVFTVIGICHTRYVECLLARSVTSLADIQHNLTNTINVNTVLRPPMMDSKYVVT